MKFVGEIYEPLYEHNERKYVRILIPPQVSQRVIAMHSKHPRQRFNPLDGNILTVKVPYRYKRVMVKMNGLKGVSSFVIGDKVEFNIDFKGTWKIDDNHSGYTWLLKETTYM